MHAAMIESMEGECASSQRTRVGLLSRASLIQALEIAAREAAPGVTVVEGFLYLQCISTSRAIMVLSQRRVYADMIERAEGACASSQTEQIKVFSRASLIQALESAAREAAPGSTVVEGTLVLAVYLKSMVDIGNFDKQNVCRFDR